MEIKPIKNNRDYREALKEIDRLMDDSGVFPGAILSHLLEAGHEWQKCLITNGHSPYQ